MVDTGCIKTVTVTGKAWMNHLISSINEDSRKLIRINPSRSGFKFGIRGTQQSLGQYEVPVKLGDENIMLTMDVIDIDIPCLLSKTAMIKSRMVIDMGNNTVTMFWQSIDMVNVPSGHSAITIRPYNTDRGEEFYSFVTVTENTEYNIRRIKHIHEQLGHPGRTTLETMFRDESESERFT